VRSAERGFLVVLAGPRNAGKSTLFNILVGENRAIVHHIAGTTRDVVSERMVIEGCVVTIADTAGLGETDNEVEAVGIRRSREWLECADMVVWVTPGDRDLEAGERDAFKSRDPQDVFMVISGLDRGNLGTKEALAKDGGFGYCTGSLVDASSVGPLIEMVVKEIGERSQTKGGGALRTQRQREIGRRVLRALERIDAKASEEIVAEYLREAIEATQEFFGASVSEDVLEKIFSSFCIGK